MSKLQFQEKKVQRERSGEYRACPNTELVFYLKTKGQLVIFTQILWDHFHILSSCSYLLLKFTASYNCPHSTPLLSFWCLTMCPCENPHLIHVFMSLIITRLTGVILRVGCCFWKSLVLCIHNKLLAGHFLHMAHITNLRLQWQFPSVSKKFYVYSLLSSFNRHDCRKLKNHLYRNFYYLMLCQYNRSWFDMQLVEGSVITSVCILWWSTVKVWICVLSLII